MSNLQQQIVEATKTAMKARDKARVAALRLVNAELKRVEVDERKTLTDTDVLAVLNKMLKQRRDSLGQFTDAGRMDLADLETFEIDVIQTFMPQALSTQELELMVDQALTQVGASSMKDMGQVMALLREQTAGRADMAQLSAVVKQRLV